MQISRFLVVAMMLGSIAFAGCGDDEDAHDADGAVDEGGSHHEHLESEACEAIRAACHDADTGQGEVSECHLLAHADDDADCMAESDRCIDLCGGEHRDEDGGHDES